MRHQFTQVAVVEACRYDISASIARDSVMLTDKSPEIGRNWKSAQNRAEAKLKLIARARRLHRLMFGRNPR